MQEIIRSNEELAILIKAGNTELYTVLWQQIKGLLYRYARKHYHQYYNKCISSGIELNDLIQESYFALCDAVKAFEPSTGFKLSSYLAYPIKNRFAEMHGFRGRKNEPLLHGVISIDTPLTDTEEYTLADTLPSESASSDFETSAERIYNEQLHNALDKAMNTTLNKNQAFVLREHYYSNKTLSEISSIINVSSSRAQQIEHKAIRALKGGKSKEILKAFTDDILSERAYHSTGLSAFGNNCASSVEMAIEFAEKRLEYISPSFD